MPVEARPPDAVVLCGGLGTRLRPVLSDRPKAMAPILGRPFLEWLLLQVAEQGVQRAVLASGHLGSQIREHFPDGFAGIEIRHSVERVPLGTGGALRSAADLATGGRLLVLNGDSYCRFDLERLAVLHNSTRASATLWLAPVASRDRFGSVAVDAEGRVITFGEKLEQGAGLVSAGIYLLEPEVVAAIAVPSSLEMEVLPGLIGRGLHAVAGDSPLVDIGTPETLAGAESELAGEFHRMGGAP